MGETKIHETAIVADGATLGEGAVVGPFSIVDAGAVIGDGTVLGPRVHIHGCCRIGARNRIGDCAVLGGPPQSLGWDRDDTLVVLGDDNVIGEYATINRGSEPGGETRVGDRCYFMSYTHLGHDCHVGDEVVMTSFAGLSGHCLVEDHANIGGRAGAHQFVRIGTHAILGAGAGVSQDVPPYMAVQGHPAKMIGPNAIGLRRAGVPAGSRDALKRCYKILCLQGLSIPNALAQIRAEVEQTAEVRHLVEFIEGTKRGIAR